MSGDEPRHPSPEPFTTPHRPSTRTGTRMCTRTGLVRRATHRTRTATGPRQSRWNLPSAAAATCRGSLAILSTEKKDGPSPPGVVVGCLRSRDQMMMMMMMTTTTTTTMMMDPTGHRDTHVSEHVQQAGRLRRAGTRPRPTRGHGSVPRQRHRHPWTMTVIRERLTAWAQPDQSDNRLPYSSTSTRTIHATHASATGYRTSTRTSTRTHQIHPVVGSVRFRSELIKVSKLQRELRDMPKQEDGKQEASRSEGSFVDRTVYLGVLVPRYVVQVQ